MTACGPKGYAHVDRPVLRRLLRCPLVALASHWTFQGWLQMDRTERCFKVGLDLALTTALRPVVGLGLGRTASAWAVAAGLAHSLNFLFNGHLWGVLKTYGRAGLPPRRRACYLAGLAGRLHAEPALRFAALYGSHARGELGACSDVDLRLVRRPGPWHGLRASAFLLAERTRALLARVPLDAYLLDSEARLARLRPDEAPVVLLRTAEGGR